MNNYINWIAEILTDLDCEHEVSPKEAYERMCYSEESWATDLYIETHY